MNKKNYIEGLQCECSQEVIKDRIAYILYPMDLLSDWIESASERYNTTIVVVTGMDWETAFSPWPEKGVPAGSPDFKGGSPRFLELLRNKIIPQVETALGISENVERTLVGVSMSGLFALWQWMICDTFHNIASLSGSFWYEGFIEWMKSRTIPTKEGKAFFLLGDMEPLSRVKEFRKVGQNTQEILSILRSAGINATFESVPGDHFADPISRLEKAFISIYNNHQA